MISMKAIVYVTSVIQVHTSPIVNVIIKVVDDSKLLKTLDSQYRGT
ncbi:hypothetical protein H1P_690018 [Hyella patelloides LEGE 07179]|uniref:Uncharacterized protein n=1 Tax=Hyella patelloides LEGE 07179 TaxID=945734 RepID=A0A563W335_9CYAN|nr:hypothetical protein H1P_690018 [Hyella patelloides LEGE 07179]